MNQSLVEVAQRWVDEDPDPITRDAGRTLLEAGDMDALRAHFGQRLRFGTAGMRGALGPGPNRMNRALVRRVTAGLGQYVLSTVNEAASRGAVIGFDGRHGSRNFAEDAAAVLGGLGFRVYLFEQVVPTPTLGHALLELGGAVGIMVTASHNPPQDNGYKVYWSNGAQIIPPHDRGITQAIDEVGALGDITVPDLDSLRNQGLLRPVPASVEAAYLAAVDELRVYDGPSGNLSIVYTAMHGVGRQMVERVLARHGYGLHVVAAQGEPDPDFPTVSFPNPEEDGAMDLALDLARDVSADLVIANDPDADRLAVAIPTSKGYRQLTGNQVGALLADELLRYGDQDDRRLVVNTIVSSGILEVIAEAHGVDCRHTLTGFKWIANLAIDHDATGGRFVMGFEEALGYTVGPVVRDKDGVSTALLFCDLAARCRAEGKTVLNRLEELARRYGVFVSCQHSIKLPGERGAEQIREMMTRLRRDPPKLIGGAAVRRVRDYQTREARDLISGESTVLQLPVSNVLAFDLDGARVLARPSGTEPKIKFYFEVRGDIGAEESLADAESRARETMHALQAEFVSRYGRVMAG